MIDPVEAALGSDWDIALGIIEAAVLSIILEEAMEVGELTVAPAPPTGGSYTARGERLRGPVADVLDTLGADSPMREKVAEMVISRRVTIQAMTVEAAQEAALAAAAGVLHSQ